MDTSLIQSPMHTVSSSRTCSRSAIQRSAVPLSARRADDDGPNAGVRRSSYREARDYRYGRELARDVRDDPFDSIERTETDDARDAVGAAPQRVLEDVGRGTQVLRPRRDVLDVGSARRVVADGIFGKNERSQRRPRQNVAQEPRLGAADAEVKERGMGTGVHDVATVGASHGTANADELSDPPRARVESPRDDADGYSTGERRLQRAHVVRVWPPVHVEERAVEIDREGVSIPIKQSRGTRRPCARSASQPLVFHGPVDEREEREVLAQPRRCPPGVDGRAINLPNENAPGRDLLAAVDFDPTLLGVRVAAVARAACTFL